MNPDPTAADPLPHARSLAAVGSVFVLALSGLCWGQRGFVSAAAGSLLSFVNVWAIERFARRAVERAADWATCRSRVSSRRRSAPRRSSS